MMLTIRWNDLNKKSKLEINTNEESTSICDLNFVRKILDSDKV